MRVCVCARAFGWETFDNATVLAAYVCFERRKDEAIEWDGGTEDEQK